MQLINLFSSFFRIFHTSHLDLDLNAKQMNEISSFNSLIFHHLMIQRNVETYDIETFKNCAHFRLKTYRIFEKNK